MNSKLLLRRYAVTQNKALDGINDKLNSKNIVDG